MKIQQQIQEKLKLAFTPIELVVENESHNHSVPAGSETHFKVLIVSDHFQGLSRIERQQAIYKVLSDELKSGVHALSQRVYTSQEWQKEKNKLNFVSPECLGGSKKDLK